MTLLLLLDPLSLSLLAVLLLTAFYTLTLLSSPLRKLPGPSSSLLTSISLRYHELRAKRTSYVHGLHLKYGPVVRLAPNEVSFSSAEAVREIYCSGGSGYDKTEFYDLFTQHGRRTMFSMLNKTDHAKRRRVLADRYANSNIMKPASLDGIIERSKRFISACEEAQDGTVDLFIKLHNYAFDCASHHLFHPHGSDSLRDKNDEDIMLQVAFDDSLQNRLIQYYNPRLHKIVSGVLSLFAKPRETPLANELVFNATSKPDAAPFTLLSRMQEKAQGLEEVDMAAECSDHMAAGIDTTGDALCFLMWEISQPRNAHIQRRLQDEIRSNKDASFDKLPYLDAVLSEGLRCFPAIPMSLPRYVPAGGRTIDGCFVPGGAIVSSQAYSTHRIDEAVFPRPNDFDPDRWLQVEGDVERKRLFFAFASGGRGCVGKHLAMAEMKILLRDVYARFSTLPHPAMEPALMQMSDQLISSQPLGQTCLVEFAPLQD